MKRHPHPIVGYGPEYVDQLLGPLSLTTLLNDYWGRRTYVGNRKRPRPFHGLPTEEDFERLLASLTAPQSGWFSLVKERARAPEVSSLNADGWLNLSDVHQAYRDGYSLLQNQVQKRHDGTARLCRSLEMALHSRGVLLSRHIGANLYLSPPRSQGFSIHYDPHDVLIFQLEGRKSWRIYERRALHPLQPPDEPFTPEESGPVERAFILSPGDIVYIPRGVLHDASTLDKHSLHLTLSIELATWHDLLSEVLKSDPQFGQALPIGLGRSRSEDRTAVAAQTRLLADSSCVDAALSSARTRLFSKLDRLPAAGPSRNAEAASIGGNTVLGLAAGVFGEVIETDERTVLFLPGISLSAPRAVAPAFRYLTTAQRFLARDLPLKAPLGQRLEFLRNLVLGGFLAVHKRR